MKERILIVEDDPINREVLKLWLQKIGNFDVQEAANGKEALEMIDADPPDCILMDLKMPILDGWDTTRQIRASQTHRRLPVIAVTAQALLGDEERALAAGCNAYLAKPIRNYRELAAKIAPFLRRNETGDASTGEVTERPEVKQCGKPLSSQTPELLPAEERVSEPLDPEALATLRREVAAGDEAFLDRFFITFLDNTAATIELLREAARGGDARGLEQAAHSLKGSGWSVGARSLAEICQQLEMLGQAESIAGAGELIDELEQEFDRVKDALKPWSGSPSSPR